MRTVTGPETTLLQGAHLATLARVLVEDADGTYQDLTSLDSLDWVHSGRIAQTIDQIVATGTFMFWRSQEGGNSLAPLDEDSTLNRNAGDAYAPLINVGRGIRCEFATVAIGSTPSGGDWQRVFEGVIDEWTVDDDFVHVLTRDAIGAEIADRWAEQERELGTTGGKAIEDVMQDILTEWTSLTLYTPTSPSFLVTTYTQQRSTVLEALQQLAALIGWVVQPRWDDGTSSFRLTFYDPVRAPGSTDWTWAADRYEAVPDFTLSRLDIRNALSLWYTNTSGVRLQVTATDGASITAYDRQFMEIEEPEDSPIDTATEAQDMLDKALLDLKDPVANQEIKTLCFWPIQLNDYYLFTANDVHYTVDQSYGVTGFRHEFGGGHVDTFIRTRGKPAGFVTPWIVRGGDPPVVEDVEILNAFLRSIPFVNTTGFTNGINGDIIPDLDTLDTSNWSTAPHWNDVGADGGGVATSDQPTATCPSKDTFTFSVRMADPGGTPAADSDEQSLILHLRIRKQETSGTNCYDSLLELYQGDPTGSGVLKATLTQTNETDSIYHDLTKTITNAEYDAITDHNDLYLKVTGNVGKDDESSLPFLEVDKIKVQYLAKVPKQRGVKIDLIYDPSAAVDELDLVLTWNEGAGPLTHSYTKTGVAGAAASERLQKSGGGDFFMREDWTGFDLDVTPVAQPGDVNGRLVKLFLEDATETPAGIRAALTAGGTALADFFVDGAGITVDLDANGRPRINAGGAGSALTDLSDVTAPSPATNDILQKSAGDWVNRTLAAAGISAVGHTHPASGITAGTFGAGAYTFPSTLAVTGTSIFSAIPTVSLASGNQDAFIIKAAGQGQWQFELNNYGSGAGEDLGIYVNSAVTRFVRFQNKGAGDLGVEITGTLAVTGTTAFSAVAVTTQAAATDAAFGGQVTGDSFLRFIIQEDGKFLWGPGSATRDTNLYRSAADTLKTDDAFAVAGTLAVAGVTTLSQALDFTSNGTPSAGRIFKDAVHGIAHRGEVGSTNDWVLHRPDGTAILRVPTGTSNLVLAGTLAVTGVITASSSITSTVAVGTDILNWNTGGKIQRLTTGGGIGIHGTNDSLVYVGTDANFTALIGATELNIVAATATEDLWLAADDNVTIISNRVAGVYPTNTHEWTFGTDSILTGPGGTWTIAGSGATLGLSINTNQLTAGILPVARGGLGIADPTLGNLVLGGSAGPMTQLAFGAAGGFARSSGTAWARSTIQVGDLPSHTHGAADINAGTLAGAFEFTTQLDLRHATDIMLRLQHTSATGNPSIGFFQSTTTERARLAFLDANDEFRYNVVLVGGRHSFRTSGVEYLRITGVDANEGQVRFDNSQSYWVPVDKGVTAGAIDPDEGNIFFWDNDGGKTISMSPTPQEGYVFIIYANRVAGAASAWTWPAPWKWIDGIEPTMGTAAGEVTKIVGTHEDGNFVMDWAVYS